MTQELTEAEAALLGEIDFDDAGLVPVVAQERTTGEVLMLAWMSRDAVLETLRSGQACYWSRSRDKLWRKGETSGQTQALKEFRIDCDGDAVLLLVEQTGVACHTGRRSCFYRQAHESGLVEILPVETDPDELYGEAGR
ncbi:MAG: phosphoribosyl-AMP cyclohydrolase [Alphaproteobacteria bacterium]